MRWEMLGAQSPLLSPSRWRRAVFSLPKEPRWEGLVGDITCPRSRKIWRKTSASLNKIGSSWRVLPGGRPPGTTVERLSDICLAAILRAWVGRRRQHRWLCFSWMTEEVWCLYNFLSGPEMAGEGNRGQAFFRKTNPPECKRAQRANNRALITFAYNMRRPGSVYRTALIRGAALSHGSAGAGCRTELAEAGYGHPRKRREIGEWPAGD